MALQILFEETLYQKSSKETLLVELLKDKNIIPGIKVGIWTSCTAQLLLKSRSAWGRQCGDTGQNDVLGTSWLLLLSTTAEEGSSAAQTGSRAAGPAHSHKPHTKASVC